MGDTTKRTTPTKVLELTSVKQLTAGGDHSLALHGNGMVSSFGRNNFHSCTVFDCSSGGGQ